MNCLLWGVHAFKGDCGKHLLICLQGAFYQAAIANAIHCLLPERVFVPKHAVKIDLAEYKRQPVFSA